MPRFMAIIKATARSEAGQMPTEQEMRDMVAFNEELVNAGVIVSADGVHPSSKGVRIDFDGRDRPSVTDGPFTETKELIGGFWILEARSLAEAVEWMKRAPLSEGQIELRQVITAEDFADMPDDVRARIDRLDAIGEARLADSR